MSPSNSPAVEWEYGIGMVKNPGAPHRWGMTLEEAREWLDGWIADGGNSDVFVVIQRPVGAWHPTMQSAYGPTRVEQ